MLIYERQRFELVFSTTRKSQVLNSQFFAINCWSAQCLVFMLWFLLIKKMVKQLIWDFISSQSVWKCKYSLERNDEYELKRFAMVKMGKNMLEFLLLSVFVLFFVLVFLFLLLPIYIILKLLKHTHTHQSHMVFNDCGTHLCRTIRSNVQTSGKYSPNKCVSTA